MMLFVAFAAGYVLGASAEKEEFGDVVRAMRAVSQSEEMRDLAAVVRSHAGHALRGVADFVERGAGTDSVRATASSVVSAEMFERVRRLISDT